MREVNWTALNVRLCEALKVKKVHDTCRCGHYHPFLPPGWTCGRHENGDRCECKNYDPIPVYPNIISVDALMPLLAARGEEHFSLWRSRWYQKRQELGVSTVDNHEWWAGTGLAPARGHGAATPGHALALAAAATLGVEVPYV